MLKIWLGKDGGSIIVSKSDPQHDLMEGLGFKLVAGINYGSMNRVDPGDFSVYRAIDYLSNDSIYRCMRINDGTDEKFMALKKQKLSKNREKTQNKIVMSPDEVITVPEVDSQYLACAACKRIFRRGHLKKLSYCIVVHQDTGVESEWSYRHIVCCDKFYVIGDNPNIPGYVLACCTLTQAFKWGMPTNISNEEQNIIDYIKGKKEAKKIERTN